ncbi:Hsp20/alpha crystallin family protein [Diplocloster modestus]|uniref:Hsp20/alpha crystallin family protein n=1 Tax=Diplocloster modestus TaxID=2850322 RepID=A0ABS6K4G3_9FIRM|nr:Hsp20/alpha crystallin family protein [Diplocloster modestus]MBU9725387.1 Hsp20/alpha crystallin family protein [Diplocloster modestus]
MLNLMPFSRREDNLFNYLDNLEKNFFGDMDQNLSQFRTDIIDDGDHYTMKADLPGFTKEDIHIDLNDNTLTIHAEHNEENETKKDNYVRRERRYGSFSRSFDVTNINTSDIDATYANGVLELKLPKLEAVVPEPRKIEVK